MISLGQSENTSLYFAYELAQEIMLTRWKNWRFEEKLFTAAKDWEIIHSNFIFLLYRHIMHAHAAYMDVYAHTRKNTTSACIINTLKGEAKKSRALPSFSLFIRSFRKFDKSKFQ